MRPSLIDRLLGFQVPEADGAPRTMRRTYRLDSDLPGARFDASIQASWHPADLASEDFVFQRLHREANTVTSRYSVLDAAKANDDLNTSLAVPRVIPPGDIRVAGARAVLSVPEGDLDYAKRRADIEREASIATADLEAKRVHLMRLRDMFLSDSAMARLWWSNGDPDRLLRLADHKATFDTVVSMVAGSSESPVQQDVIAPLIARFLASLGPDHRKYLIGQLAKIFDGYEQPKLAEELRTIEM